MLVIGVAADAAGLHWRGRRHDDDSGSAAGDSAAALFDEVFGALHDGEQVAVGFAAPLSLPDTGGGGALESAESDRPAVRELGALLTELGRWRPWTVVSTSLPRWRATTSVLVWETDSDDLDAAVEAFFALADGDRGAEQAGTGVLNLAAAAAERAALTVDTAQLHEPVVLVSVAAVSAAGVSAAG
jgi:hypothetical protein